MSDRAYSAYNTHPAYQEGYEEGYNEGRGGNGGNDDIDKIVLLTYLAAALLLFGYHALRGMLDSITSLAREKRRMREILALVSTDAANRLTTCDQSRLQLPECAMCLDEMVPDSAVSRLPCGHLFHTACILKWMRYTAFRMRTCPLCRSNPLVSKEEVADVVREAEEAEEQEERDEAVGADGIWGTGSERRREPRAAIATILV